MDQGAVFAASIVSAVITAAVLMGVVVGDRATARRGKPPNWFILSGLTTCTGVLLLAYFDDSHPFVMALVTILVGTLLGGGIAYYAGRWVMARAAARAPGDKDWDTPWWGGALMLVAFVWLFGVFMVQRSESIEGGRWNRLEELRARVTDPTVPPIIGQLEPRP